MYLTNFETARLLRGLYYAYDIGYATDALNYNLCRYRNYLFSKPRTPNPPRRHQCT